MTKTNDSILIGINAGDDITDEDLVFEFTVPTKVVKVKHYRTIMTPEEAKVVKAVVLRAVNNTTKE